MQEINYIHLSRPDYAEISSSALLPTLVHEVTERYQTKTDDNVGVPAEFLMSCQSLMERKWQKVTSLCGYLLVTNKAKKRQRQNNYGIFAT